MSNILPNLLTKQSDDVYTVRLSSLTPALQARLRSSSIERVWTVIAGRRIPFDFRATDRDNTYETTPEGYRKVVASVLKGWKFEASNHPRPPTRLLILNK